MRLGICCGVFALLVAILVGSLSFLPEKVKERLVFVEPEPAGLAEAIKSSPVSKLTEKEIEALKEDGVLMVRGLVKGQDLLRELRARMETQANMPFEATFLNQKSWLYNGAVRALLRDGPLGKVLAQALGEQNNIMLNESPIWGYPAHRWVTPNAWHTDARIPNSTLLSIWMVLTDGPVALQFLKGSHKWRTEIEDDCAKLVQGGKAGFKSYNGSCVEKYFPRLEKELGVEPPAMYGPDLQAGDAFLFWGDTLHRGIRQTYKRTAISLRATWLPKRAGEACAYGNPFIYHAGGLPATQDFDCAPWAVVPGLPKFTPWLPASGNKVLRMLDWRKM